MRLKYVQFVLKNGLILVNIDLFLLDVDIFLEKCKENILVHFNIRRLNLDVLKNGFVQHQTVLNVSHLPKEEIYVEFIVVQFNL